MMQQVVTATAEPKEEGPVGRILASGNADGLRIDVVELDDKTLAITFDRRPRLGYRWEADQMEPCVNTFLRLMRH
jgi:hypothetical protein